MTQAQAVVWIAVLAACSSETRYDAYEGAPAFPNRRPAYEAEGRRLGYVSNSLSDTISIVDLDAFAAVAEVPVGRDPVDIDGPHHLAADARSGVLYVALSYPALAATGPHAGHGSSARFGYVQALRASDLSPLGELRVDQNPGDIVLSPDGESLAVTHYDLARAQTGTSVAARRAALVLIEPASGLEAGTASARHVPVCVAPHGFGYSADSARLFVACAGEDAVAVVDRASATVLARVPVADAVGEPGSPLHQPYAAVLDPSGTRLAVSNIGSNSVVLFDIGEELTRRASIPVLGAAYLPAWTPDGKRLLVPFQKPAGVAVLDVETGALLAQAEYGASECMNPHEVVLDAGARAFVVCEGPHDEPGTLSEIDPETAEWRAALPVGLFPDRLVVVGPQ